MHLRVESLDSISYESIEHVVIGGVSEQRFAMIAAQRDVIAAARNVKARGSGHG
jgi:hypothetical protein